MLTVIGVLLEGKTEPHTYVYVLPDRRGQFSDAEGRYGFDLPKGRKTIIFSHSAYRSETLIVTLRADTFLTVQLKPKAYVMPEVLVPSDLQEFREETFEPYRVNYDMIRETPVFVEPDPVRAIAGLPGIRFASDLGLKMSVMNSPPDETAYFLDGIRVFNPIHFGGLVSFLDVNQMSHAEFYDVPSSAEMYGLSGAVNIRTLNDLTARNRNFLDFSFISAKAGFTRNYGKGYVSASVRGFHLYYISLFAGRDLPYSFYDGFLKGGIRAGKVLWDFGALRARGYFDYANDSTGTVLRSRWDNALFYTSGTVGDLSAKVFYYGYVQSFNSSLYGLTPDGTPLTSEVSNPIVYYGLNLSYDGTWIKAGYEGTVYDILYTAKYNGKDEDIASRDFKGWAYFQVTYPTSRFIVSTGIRSDGLYYDPNLSLKVFLTDNVAVRMLTAVSTDYLYGFPPEGDGNVRFYYFVPSFYVLTDLPQRAIFGVGEVVRSTEKYSAFVRLIYKKYLRVYDDFRPGEGYARGFSVGYTGRLLKGSASLWYSYFLRIPKTFLDAPHNLRASYSLPFRNKRIGMVFSYHTGYPSPDGGRYPDYHKLDLFVSGSLKFWKFSGQWNFTVMNVYNRKNVFLRYYSYRDNSVHTVPQLPLFPSLYVSLRL